jgi:hypothetical protein
MAAIKGVETVVKAQRLGRVAGLTAAMGLVVGLLSGCLSLDYALNVNADSTLSGTLKVAIAKEAASTLGLNSADDFLEGVNSGEVTSGMGLNVAEDCVPSESESDLILACTITNAKASDIDEGWSMTTDGDTSTLRVVSNVDEAAAAADPETIEMPDINLGSYTFVINFPGPITSVSGTGVTQTSETSMVAQGGLSETIDFTVTGSTSTSNGLPWWSYLVIGLIAGAVVVAVIGVVQRRKKDAETTEPTTSAEVEEPPAT